MKTFAELRHPNFEMNAHKDCDEWHIFSFHLEKIHEIRNFCQEKAKLLSKQLNEFMKYLLGGFVLIESGRIHLFGI